MPVSPDDFKRFDAASYGAVAERFDRWSKAAAGPLADHVLDAAHLREGDRVLDVGTGSGLVAAKAAKRVGATGEVTGVDLSSGMLAIAMRNAEVPPFHAPLHFRAMDAERLDFPSVRFDAAVSLFAFLHFPDRRSAVREIFRVLRPGGRIAIGIGSGMPWWPVHPSYYWNRLRDLYRASAGKMLLGPRALDRYVSRELPRESEHESALHAGSDDLRVHLRQAGFVEVRTSWRSHSQRIETASEFWELQLTFSSMARKRCEQLTESRLRDLRSGFLKGCEAVQSRGGELVYRNAALVVSGRRPQ